MYDVFGNSVALVDFAQPASELQIVSTLKLERYGLARPTFPIAPEAQMLSLCLFVQMTASTLAGWSSAAIPIRRASWRSWAKRFMGLQPLPTYNLLSNMNGAIKNEFTYTVTLRGRHANADRNAAKE